MTTRQRLRTTARIRSDLTSDGGVGCTGGVGRENLLVTVVVDGMVWQAPGDNVGCKWYVSGNYSTECWNRTMRRAACPSGRARCWR